MYQKNLSILSMVEVILILCIYIIFLCIVFLSIILIWGGFWYFFFFQFYFERKKYPLNLNTRMIRNEWYPKAWEHFSPMASRYWFVQKFFFMMVKGRANKMRGNAGLLSKSWIVIFSRILSNVLVCLDYTSCPFSWDVTNVFSPGSLSRLCVWNYLSRAI